MKLKPIEALAPKHNKPVKDAYINESRLERIRMGQGMIRRISYLHYDDPYCIEKLWDLGKGFRDIGSCGNADNKILWQEFKVAKNRFIQDTPKLGVYGKAEEL